MTRYAVDLQAILPGDLPTPVSYPFVANTDEWYAVVLVTEDDAVIEDVRRAGWDLPSGVIDRREVTP